MLLGIVLLYVGAVLSINGIWLVGQTRVTGVSEPGTEVATATEGHFSFIQNREVAVINIFTGGVGATIAIMLFVLGAVRNNLSDVASAGFVLLFAFTYLWVAANQFLNAGNHAFGWYCLFVAITAVPTAVFTLMRAAGNVGSIWLGIDWFAWAVLWLLFFLLLSLDWPIARLTGYVSIIVGIGTSWALGYALLQGSVSL